MLEIVDLVLGGWMGRPRKGSKIRTVAFAIAVPIWSLFGFMLVAAGSPAIWPQDWSRHRVEGLATFIVGLLLIALITASVINTLRDNRTAK
jgi:hypothetical protein